MIVAIVVAIDVVAIYDSFRHVAIAVDVVVVVVVVVAVPMQWLHRQ